MDWLKSADKQFDDSEKISTGIQKLRVIKVLNGKKDGSPFKSKNGDPQMMVVFKNTKGEEGPCMFTLSEKAVWTLAKFMSRAGVNLEKMNADGVTHAHFEDPQFAKRVLMDRVVWADVTYREGKSGKEYPNFDFMHENEVPVQLVVEQTEAAKHQPVEEEDIPF